MTRAERLLCDLIAVPSVNPGFAAGDDPAAGEKRVAEFLAATLAKGGLDVELQPVLPGRPNLLARLSPLRRPRRRVVLAPHLDTVGGPGTPDVLFTPRCQSGRIHGRGACDTKGSVAAMACALLALARRRRPVTTEFVLVGLVDEEKSQSGSRAIARSGLKADLAIVGEPTGLQVVTAHKGDVWLKLETTGRAAHGATPHLGRNAIAAMARVVEALETDYAGRLKQQHHPLLGHPSINTGTIRGGHQPNIVPDHCEITVDRRMLPGETEPTVRGELRRWFREQGLPVRFGTYPKKASPALETDPDLPLVRRMLDAARQRGPAGVDYFCDASILAEAGMSSVVFGPGDIAQAHTADEWISCRELNQALEVLLRFLTTFD